MWTPSQLIVKYKPKKFKTVLITNGSTIQLYILEKVQARQNSEVDGTSFCRREGKTNFICPSCNTIDAGLKFVLNYCQVMVSIRKLKVIKRVMLPVVIRDIIDNIIYFYGK